MEPVEMALAATAACLINSISFNAARIGIDTQGLERICSAAIRSAEPVPISKRNFSPFPSSTSQQLAA